MFISRTRKLLLFLFLGIMTGAAVSRTWAEDGDEAPAPVTKHRVRRRVRRKVAKVAPTAVKQESVVKLNPPTDSKSAYKRKDSVTYWLKKMKARVEKTESKHKQLIAVAAVRGADMNDAPPLYWKGKSAKGVVEESEVQQFNSAVDDALGGDSVSAKSKLETFVAANPNSPLKDDAQHTLDLINEELAGHPAH